MTLTYCQPRLEVKFARFGDLLNLGQDAQIEGYASLFNQSDQGGDVVQPGAYATSLARHKTNGTRIKMLWQHDPTRPIGVWDTVTEDARGLQVRGRILTETQQGAEAAALIKAGAIEGLSIGYRTVKSSRDAQGQRLLHELTLWEVSLVTFPMLPTARLDAQSNAKSDETQTQDTGLRALAHSLRAATKSLSS